MTKIKAKPIPGRKVKAKSNRDIYALICFYYPQYKLKEAQKLPARDISLLFKTIKEVEATRMFNLTQIIGAQFTKNYDGIKKLTRYYERIMNGES